MSWAIKEKCVVKQTNIDTCEVVKIKTCSGEVNLHVTVTLIIHIIVVKLIKCLQFPLFTDTLDTGQSVFCFLFFVFCFFCFSRQNRILSRKQILTYIGRVGPKETDYSA